MAKKKLHELSFNRGGDIGLLSIMCSDMKDTYNFTKVEIRKGYNQLFSSKVFETNKDNEDLYENVMQKLVDENIFVTEYFTKNNTLFIVGDNKPHYTQFDGAGTVKLTFTCDSIDEVRKKLEERYTNNQNYEEYELIWEDNTVRFTVDFLYSIMDDLNYFLLNVIDSENVVAEFSFVE